jgi:GT2 family glycosyltransferase
MTTVGNRFVFNRKPQHDVIVVIPTLPKPENARRLSKILKMIETEPPPVDYNIYLAYEGSDWNEAINISFDRLLPSVRHGLILLNDDAYPMHEWMKDFDKYLAEYPESIFQFTSLNQSGKFGTVRIIKMWKPLKLIMLLLVPSYLPWLKYDYWWIFEWIKFRPSEPVKQSSGGDVVYLPKKVIESLGHVASKPVMYYEDTDYIARAVMEGFEVFRIANHVFHVVGATKRKKSKEYLSRTRASLKWLSDKWLRDPAYILEMRQGGGDILNPLKALIMLLYCIPKCMMFPYFIIARILKECESPPFLD